MRLYLDIFITFFKIGLVSFGGGYAMIPIIQEEVEIHHWITTKQFTDVIAVSAMAPGPIAANSAAIVGYKLDSLLGAVIACLGVILPSLILILIIGKFFSRFNEHPVVKAAFYGLRPTIVGIIAYASVKLALADGIIGGSGIIEIKGMIIMIVAITVLLKFRLHPVYLMLASGAAGIVLFR